MMGVMSTRLRAYGMNLRDLRYVSRIRLVGEVGEVGKRVLYDVKNGVKEVEGTMLELEDLLYQALWRDLR